MNIPIDKGLEETVMNNIHKVTTNADKTVDNARYFISLLQKEREREQIGRISTLSLRGGNLVNKNWDKSKIYDPVPKSCKKKHYRLCNKISICFT